MRWRRKHDEDWLDCQGTAWLRGYDDGFGGRQADVTLDGRAHPRLSSEHRNYRDGFVTGQAEREIEGQDCRSPHPTLHARERAAERDGEP